MIWTQPDISKIYEALGAIGDARFEPQFNYYIYFQIKFTFN